MDYNGQPPQLFYQPPPAPPRASVDYSSCRTYRSIETLAVVLAVITIVSVVAGIIARLCGGRHLLGGGDGGDHDIEGWVEKKCRTCLDGGLPPPEEPAKPPVAAETEKK